MTARFFAALMLVLAILPCPVNAAADQERKEGPLVVYSDDLMFVVREPQGWQGDIENAPKIGAGVALYRKNETFEKNNALIAVRVARKVDENTALDLDHEINGFRELYPDAEFGDLRVKHPSYASFAKIFSVPKNHYEYVTFLNPGRVAPYLFSVAMSTGKREASKAELKAYREVVRSIEYIPQEGARQPARAGVAGEGPK